MVRPERLELPTLGSEGRCSIQLSYGRVEKFAVRLKASRLGCQTLVNSAAHEKLNRRTVSTAAPLRGFGWLAVTLQKGATVFA